MIGSTTKAGQTAAVWELYVLRNLEVPGYFHSFFLLKEQLSPEQLKRELQTMNWFTMFGACYQLPSHAGEVADNLRALADSKANIRAITK